MASTTHPIQFYNGPAGHIIKVHTKNIYYCNLFSGENIISVDVVKCSIYSIYLNWSCLGEGCSNPQCKYTYNITYNDNILSNEENSINITENIHSCTTYSGVIKLIYDENPVSSASFVATTLPDGEYLRRIYNLHLSP